MQTVDHCAWVHLGTVEKNLHMVWTTALFLHSFTFTWWHSRELLPCHSRLLGLALRLSRSFLLRGRRKIPATLEAGLFSWFAPSKMEGLVVVAKGQFVSPACPQSIF